MRSFSPFFLLLLLGGLWGCKTAKAPFVPERCANPAFYQQALGWEAGTHRQLNVVVYKTIFQEQKVESGEVLISPSLNRYSNRRVADYDNRRKGYKQELYLVRLDGGSMERDTFVYFSVLYKAGRQRGFSRAYVGSAYTPRSVYFHLELYMADDSGQLVLKPKLNPLLRKADSAHLLFVADSLRPEGDMNFTRIVDREDNKFGGADPYVFEVRKHFTDLPRGLRFYRLAEYHFHQ